MITAMRLQNFDAEPEALSARTALGKTYDEDETRDMVRAAYERGLREGRSEGRAAGRAQAEAEADADMARTMDALSSRLADLAADIGAHRAALESQMLEFVLSVCDAVFPELVDKLSSDRVSKQVHRALKMAIGSASVRIRLAPVTRDAMAAELAHRLSYYRIDNACRIEADPDLRPGDVRMEWDHGSLEYAYETVTGLILEELRKTHAAAQAARLERSGHARR